MTQDDSKLRTDPAHYFRAARVCYLGLALLSMVLLAGCSTVTTYKPHLAAGLAKPVDYPVLVFTEDMTVPRPCEVIGTVTVGSGHFTMRGGSAESEMLKVMQTAREKGADVIQMKSMQQPDFGNADFRLVADLLRYTDAWETIAISEGEFASYLKTNQRNLDPIEGVWNGYGPIPHRIGIMRNTSKLGRDFIGFILNTVNPTWHKGCKKIDIRRGTKPGTYIFDYYLDDFSERVTTVILGENATFTLAFPTSEEKTDLITYSKEQ
jgi:hypothetical protein